MTTWEVHRAGLRWAWSCGDRAGYALTHRGAIRAVARILDAGMRRR